MKRIISLLAAMAIMAALVVASAMPAFAFEHKDTKSQGNAVGKLESSYTANGTTTPGSRSLSSVATQCGQCLGIGFSTLARQ